MKAVWNQPLSPSESVWHDRLRIFLIAEVVLGHVAAIALERTSTLTSNGFEGLVLAAYRIVWRFGPQGAYLFVFLSGFMVAGSLIRSSKQDNVAPGRRFFSSRFAKLLPVAWIALFVTIILDVLGQLLSSSATMYQHTYAGDLTAHDGIVVFLGNLAFLQPVLVNAFGSNGPLWTLGYIAQYYVIGYFLARVGQRRRLVAVFIGAFVIVIMLLIRPEWGILFVAWLVGGIMRILPRLPVASWSTGVAAAGLFVLSNLLPPLASAAAAILVGAAVCDSFKGLGASHRHSQTWRNLSERTFTIYAVHHPILIFVFIVLFHATAASLVRFLCFLGAGLAVSVVMTMAIDVAIERSGFRSKVLALGVSG